MRTLYFSDAHVLFIFFLGKSSFYVRLIVNCMILGFEFFYSLEGAIIRRTMHFGIFSIFFFIMIFNSRSNIKCVAGLSCRFHQLR